MYIDAPGQVNPICAHSSTQDQVHHDRVYSSNPL